MIEYILYMIGIWCLIGFVSAVVDIYLFFRGMKHMIQCHLFHKNPAIREVGKVLDINYKQNKSLTYITFFVMYTILGIFTTIVLICDFFRFSQNNS